MKSTTAVLCVLLSCSAPCAAAGEFPKITFGAVIDGRLGRTDDTPGWLDGGLGKTRYGGTGREPVLRLAQASLLVHAELGPTLDARLHVNLDAEPGAGEREGRVSPVEAVVSWRPALSSSLGLRARAGTFFPPVSLEHSGPAWTTLYTITPSAANTWIGEDVRPTGAELTLTLTRGRHEIAAMGAIYGWNDPSGTLLAWRGWALHDRQTGLFQRLPLAPIPAIGPTGMFTQQPLFTAPLREVDHRPGYYAAASWRVAGRLEARVLHSDSRADESAFRDSQYAWATRFTSLGLRLDLPAGIELVAQRVATRSRMGRIPGGDAVDVEPAASFVLISGAFGRHRLTLRHDRFRVEDMGPLVAQDDNNEHGTAWTAAYVLKFGEKHRLALEALRVESTRAARASLRLPTRARELLLQASLRLRF